MSITLELIAITCLIVVIFAAVVRFGRLSVNDAATFAVAIGSLGAAIATIVISERSRDAVEAIGQLTRLAASSQDQTKILRRQVRSIQEQLAQQRIQTRILSEQSAYLSEQASASRSSSDSAREQIAQSALINSEAVSRASFEARWKMQSQSLLDYNRAIASYTGTINSIRTEMDVDVDTAEGIDALTEADLVKLRKAAKPIAAARRELEGSFGPIVVNWPRPIRVEMARVFSSGQLIGECLEFGTVITKSEDGVRLVKARLKATCPNIASRLNKFTGASKSLGVELLNIVYAAAAKVGTEPDELVPERR